MRMKAGLVALGAAALIVGNAGAALADHSHFVVRVAQDGTRHCQYLAAGQSEPSAVHPLHYLVHLGHAGSDSNGTDVDKNANEAARCDVVSYPGSKTL